LSYVPKGGGIQGLAPKNALVLVSRFRWVSHCSSPFAWIERLKSFSFLAEECLSGSLKFVKSSLINRLGNRLQFRAGFKHFLFAVAVNGRKFVRVAHALNGSMDVCKRVLKVKRITQVFQFGSDVEGGQGTLRVAEYEANGVTEAEGIDVPSVFEYERSEGSDALVELGLAVGHFPFLDFYLFKLLPRFHKGVEVGFTTINKFNGRGSLR